MTNIARLVFLVLLLIPVAALAMVEKDTKKEYPDKIDVGSGDSAYTLVGTGVALREKTFMKVDVYTIASYVSGDLTLTGDKARNLMKARANKRLVMDLTRGFSAEKLKKAFSEIIEKNYKDRSRFEADMQTFLSYFTQEAKKGDHLVFDYNRKVGLTTILNGKEMGVITNFAFVEALWSVWFGENCADKGMRKNLTKNI